MISMSLLGIHPTFPSSISISFQSPNLLLIEIFVPSCRITSRFRLHRENFSLSLSEQTRSRSSGLSVVLLVAGKDIGKDDQHQEYQPQIKPDLLQMNPLGEEEQDQTADKKDKTNNTDLRPRIGSPYVLNLVEPTVQEEIAHRLDLSTDFDVRSCKFCTRISRSPAIRN